MYGRYRGEAPQNVRCKFSRLREGRPSRPSYGWWMMRSDRLSHPAPLSDNCFELAAGETVKFTLNLKTAVADLSRAVCQNAWLSEDSSYAGQVFEDKNSGGIDIIK